MTLTSEPSTNFMNPTILSEYQLAIDAASELNDHQEMTELIDSYEMWVDRIMHEKQGNLVKQITFDLF